MAVLLDARCREGGGWGVEGIQHQQEGAAGAGRRAAVATASHAAGARQAHGSQLLTGTTPALFPLEMPPVPGGALELPRAVDAPTLASMALAVFASLPSITREL